MAKTVKLKEFAELGLDEPNMLHVQESYLRQVVHAKPMMAKKKNKSEVRATGAKSLRQKGTGRARQGIRTNPHMHGGGLAFAPHPRTPKKGLNKQVRQSALRSAVLLHVLNESAYIIQGKDFDGEVKTREVAPVIDKLPGTVCLVLLKDVAAWRALKNMPLVTTITPDRINVKDLLDNDFLVFTQSALDEYKAILRLHLVPTEEAKADDATAEGDDGGEG